MLTPLLIGYFSENQKKMVERLNSIRLLESNRSDVRCIDSDDERAIFILNEIVKNEHPYKKPSFTKKDFFSLTQDEKYLYLQISTEDEISEKVLEASLRSKDHTLNYLALKRIQSLKNIYPRYLNIKSLSSRFLRSKDPILQREALRLSQVL